MTKIMTLNIRNGGGVHRLEAIMNRIDMHSPDVLVLTEYRENHNSGRLREYLTKNRFLYLAAGSNDSSINFVLIASKVRFTPFMFEDFVEPEGAKSLLDARFENFHLIGCCLSALPERKLLLETYAIFFEGSSYLGNFGVVIGGVQSAKCATKQGSLEFLRQMKVNGLVELHCERTSCASECSIQSQNHNFSEKVLLL